MCSSDLKETFNIYINDVMKLTMVNQELYPCHSMMSRPQGSETVAMFEELRFYNRFENLFEALLDHSIQDAWNPKRSPFSILFLNPFSSNLLRVIVSKFGSDFVYQIFLG